ncbi:MULTISPECIES: orotidine-5'-phosphate decarboxylase [unclassified Desulfovibrio]|uniref:orotidine-5'-phosphate decarboxylase n=1 Tax=unclassified Desulfovibrio TaxID=2593640 RepID=UPI000F6013A2|nr:MULTISPECIES: orotidine-5'-phosphate decarboxylase [unclassified Desulfovibrio]RRD71870.1 orotidine-5'-phosphate decarboxylase [Desulfovibrio sp. OH1209_COT-279]RRD88083.1 orotidine-5'-phosphate decarboxylase [Desulfovibrio sp. OH1186_COT-070]
MPHADATKAQLIVALDLPTRKAALDMALKLRGTVRWCKVGMEVFTLAGPDFLEELHRLGYHVFLDLKFYDIPHTVAQAVKAAAAAGVRLLTVHCQGGERMCRAAVEAVHAAPNRPLIFGVTALTSFAAGEMPGISVPPADFALTLARCAADWNLDGVVCSAHEASAVRAACPELLRLCPGIRPAGSPATDQRRVMTPADAVMEGANYLVVGRPVTASADPAEAAQAILEEITSAAP